MNMVRHSKWIGRRRLRALFAAGALGAIAACGGGGDNAGPGDSTPAPPTGAPASTEIPLVVDPARRAEFKRSLLPLTAGTYSNGCLMTNAAGQLIEGGGPVVVNAATAASASGSVDLLAPDLDFTLYRYYEGTSTGAAVFSRGSGDNSFVFGVTTHNDRDNGPGAGASMGGNGGSSSFVGCSGPVPPLASADMFSPVRSVLPDRPVRMLDCRTLTNGTSITAARVGEVSVGPREITIDGNRVGVDDSGKQAEGMLILKNSLPVYIVKWSERDVTLEFDDGGNIRQAMISDTGASPRAVICKRPAR